MRCDVCNLYEGNTTVAARKQMGGVARKQMDGATRNMGSSIRMTLLHT